MRASTLAAMAGLMFMLAMSATQAIADEKWPQVTMPPGAQTFDIAADAVINGIPTRVSAFRSALKPEQVGAWLVRDSGHKMAETKLGNSRVLGYRAGTHFVTFQLNAGAATERGLERSGGTHAIVSITRRTTEADQARYQATLDEWTHLLPPQTRVVTHMTSTDNGRHSTLLTLTNRLSPSLNRASMTELLKRQGFQREISAAHPDTGSPRTPGTHPRSDSQADWFQGANAAEALLTTSTGADGSTHMVLNIVARLDRFTP